MQWIKTEDLDVWGRARTSETELPGLVADLIRATVPDITAMRFPSGEKGQIRGFDGHLESSVKVMNVPEGRSLWEFGTEPDYKSKAQRDFDKRSREVSPAEQRQTSWIFLTPFTWDSSRPDNKIEDWVRARRENSEWKDVCFIDGVQLEDWLACCPAVAAWHAKNTLKVAPQDGARSTDEFWEEFSNRFKPRLTEEVLLCERELATEQLLKALMGTAQQTSFIADSPDEVLAFAVASIRKAKPEVRLFLEARTLVIDTISAGRALRGKPSLSFLVRGEAAMSPGQFAVSVPTLVPLGRQQRVSSGIRLDRPTGFAMARALMTMGYSQSQAETLARGSGRSLAALARQIPGGASDEPVWMTDAELVLPAVLTGAWDASNELDREILQRLSGASDYDSYERRLRKFANDPDPPLDREGSVWKVRAPMDAFIHIGHLIGKDSLEALRPVLVEVFGQVRAEPDPNDLIDFAPAKSSRHSDWLREGLATTLLLIAAWSRQARLAIGLGDGQAFVNEVVSALPGLGTDPRLLSSLKDELPLLAEAAPDPLLAALERMLEGDGAAIRPIFEETEGLFAPVAHHTGVLWALETLAWDPAYFRRVALILAHLAAVDPGGRLANRPIASLAEIFLLWKPGTNAPPESRLNVLDEIIQKQPTIAWELLKQLLPDEHGVSIGTARPRLREGGINPPVSMTYATLWKAQADIMSRFVSLAVGDAARVDQMIATLPTFSAETRAKALALIDATLADAEDDVRLKMWRTLREIVRRHERFATAKWALSHEEIAPLRDLAARYAPVDPVIEVADLFDHWSLGAGGSDGVSDQSRISAVRKLREDHGIDAVLRLAQSAEVQHLVLDAVEKAQLSAGDVLDLLDGSFTADTRPQLSIALSGLYWRVAGAQAAEAWLEYKRTAISVERTAALLFAWPLAAATWAAARRLGRDVLEAYWRSWLPHWVEGSRRLLLTVVWNLLRRGRAVAALQTALNRLDDLPSSLLLRILEHIAPELNSSGGQPDNMIGYNLEQAFMSLDKREDVEQVRIAELEYALLPLLEYQDRTLKFYDLMAKEPVVYNQVLCEVFRADGEERRNSSEDERARWRQAYKLLSGFSTLPGLVNGVLNQSSLSKWVDHVRKLGIETRRVSITDLKIGNLLAHAPDDDEDKAWPHRVVRDEIERVRSSDLERGLQTERFNMRGVVRRGVLDGGVLERELAERYRRYATTAAAWPRTAALLLSMAERWEEDAQREDSEARKRLLRS